jgi:UDP-3-O-[3-hydroxymyristoyl] glucosamine N-acyltransferase
MEFKATDIAAFLNGEVVGDGNVKYLAYRKLRKGQPGTLSFLANPKYENYIYNTLASIVLVNNRSSQIRNKSYPYKVDDAYQAFASLLDLYVQAKKNTRKGIENPVLSI